MSSVWIFQLSNWTKPPDLLPKSKFLNIQTKFVSNLNFRIAKWNVQISVFPNEVQTKYDDSKIRNSNNLDFRKKESVLKRMIYN